ncbi:MAG TPA: hypothetical protein DD636_03500 [Anaerolineaceae bacterium]|nr:hypothetical protein [Anaerolineaceae bacterium]
MAVCLKLEIAVQSMKSRKGRLPRRFAKQNIFIPLKPNGKTARNERLTRSGKAILLYWNFMSAD